MLTRSHVEPAAAIDEAAVARAVHDVLRALIESEHTSTSIRVVRAPGPETLTSALHGVVRDDHRTGAQFLALAKH